MLIPIRVYFHLLLRSDYFAPFNRDLQERGFAPKTIDNCWILNVDVSARLANRPIVPAVLETGFISR